MKFWEGKNVLVTGGAGLTGHSAIATLLEYGATVRATTYKNRKLDLSNKRLEVVSADLSNYSECENVCKDIDIVVNTVAYIVGGKGQTENPMSLIRSNLIPSVNMIEAACRAGVDRFGFIGSSTSYYDKREHVSEENAFTSDPHPCYFGVGWMKRYCEKLAIYFHGISKTKFAMIRSTALYGPYDNFNPEKCHAIPDLIMKGHTRMDPFEIWGDGSQIRDFVYVQDLVDGLLLTIEKHPNADIINIATGVETNVTDLVKLITKVYGYNPKLVYDPSKPTMIPYRMVNVEKAKKILNWSAKYSLEEGLEKTIGWYNQRRT